MATKVLAMLFVFALLGGCSSQSRSPYYTELHDAPETHTKSMRHTRYWGNCPVHGALTNSVTAGDAVTRVVEDHNRQYHSDGVDPNWAKVHVDPD